MPRSRLAAKCGGRLAKFYRQWRRTKIKKQNKKLIILFVAVALVMLAIFLFSQQPGESSNELSKKVLDKINSSGADVLTPKITIKSSETGSESSSGFAGIIIQGRKWAHVYLYALLGVAVSLFVREFMRFRGLLQKSRLRIPFTAAASALICFLYACLDEFHQKFVEGRTGCFTDVIYDAVGFGVCIMLALLATELTAFISGRRKELSNGEKN